MPFILNYTLLQTIMKNVVLLGSLSLPICTEVNKINSSLIPLYNLVIFTYQLDTGTCNYLCHQYRWLVEDTWHLHSHQCLSDRSSQWSRVDMYRPCNDSVVLYYKCPHYDMAWRHMRCIAEMYTQTNVNEIYSLSRHLVRLTRSKITIIQECGWQLMNYC